jgi:hypothetical protein
MNRQRQTRRTEHRGAMLARKPSDRARIWTSMRVMRRFTLPELIVTAQAGESNARCYVGELHAAGYIAIAVPHRRGTIGGHQVWRLVRNSGPHAPQRIGRGKCPAIFDPNTGDRYASR